MAPTTARLVRTEVRNLDTTWIGREMIVGLSTCGVLSDIEHHGRTTVLYLSGQRIAVPGSTLALYDTLN